MLSRLPKPYLVTASAACVLAVSYAVMVLGMSDLLPRNEAWRVLIIPAYLPMLLSAIIATALSLPNFSLLWMASVAIILLPFVAIDRLLARLRDRLTRAAGPPSR